MTNQTWSRLLKICSTGLVTAAIFTGLFVSSAQNFVITVNSIEDLALAKDAKQCDTDLLDFEITCSFRAALEFAKQKYTTEPDLYDFFIINFDSDLVNQQKEILITSHLPLIDFPLIIDGLGDECSNPNVSSSPKITLQGNGAYIKGLRFESFITTTSTSAHGSKVCGLALDGFGQTPLTINGYWDNTEAVFRDAKLNSEYQISNNYFGFDKSGLSFVSDSYSSNKVAINSTKNVLFTNNLVRGDIALYNTNNITIKDSLLSVDLNGMPVSSQISQSITVGHSSIDDKTSDNIVIENNLMSALNATAPIKDTIIKNNTICFSPYKADGLQKYMNLCSNYAPINIKDATNINVTNNQIGLGQYDSGYQYEPNPQYMSYLFYSNGLVDNLNFDSNTMGLENSLMDSYYFTNTSINKLKNSTIKNSTFMGGKYGFNVYYDMENNLFENLVFQTPLTHVNRDYGIIQQYSSGSFVSNTFRDITFFNYKKSMLKAASTAVNNLFDNLVGDLPKANYTAFSKIAFESAYSSFLTPPQPEMFVYNVDSSQTTIDLKISYPTTADKCDFQVFLANQDDSDFYAKNTKRLTFAENNQSQTTVTNLNGLCTYQGQVIVPQNYIWSKTNILFYQSTDYTATSFQTTSYSDYRLFNVQMSADIIFDDYDSNNDYDFSFPIDKDVKFTLQNAQNVQKVVFDLDTSYDSDNDGVTDNDTDFVGNSLILNLHKQSVNNQSKTFSDLNSYPYNVKVDIYGLGEVITKDFYLEPFQIQFANDLDTCIVTDSQSGLATLNGPILNETLFEPRHLEFDFNTQKDTTDSLVMNANDGISDNDIDSTDPYLYLINYDTPGVKTLKVTAFDSSMFTQSKSLTHELTVYPSFELPSAEIQSTIDSQNVQFSLQSVNTCIDSVEWDFGDGNTQSGHLNTQHTYSQAGEYTVKATLVNQDFQNTIIANIIVGIQAPTANFDFSVDSQTVSFTNTSSNTNLSEFEWDFDSDGIVDSTEKNPTFNYSDFGDFTAKLTVTNAAGVDSVSKQVTIEEPLSLVLNTDFESQNINLFDQELLLDKLQTATFNLNDSTVALWQLDNGTSKFEIETDYLKLNFVENLVNQQKFELDPIEKLFLNIKTLSGQTAQYIISFVDARFSQETACLATNQENKFNAKNLNYDSYQWLLDDQEIQSQNTISLQNLANGTYNLTLIATKQNQSSIFDQTIEVLPELSTPIGHIKVLDEFHSESGVLVSLDADFIGDCLTYKWDFESDGLIDAYTKNVTIEYTPNIDYSLTLKVANQSYDTVLIKSFNFFDQNPDLITPIEPITEPTLTPEITPEPTPVEPTIETETVAAETTETPDTQTATETAEVPETETLTTETTPEPTPEVTPEPTPEITPEPTPETTPEPTPETETLTTETTPEPTPEVTPEPTPETTPETQTIKDETIVLTSPKKRKSRSSVSNYTPPIKQVAEETKDDSTKINTTVQESKDTTQKVFITDSAKVAFEPKLTDSVSVVQVSKTEQAQQSNTDQSILDTPQLLETQKLDAATLDENQNELNTFKKSITQVAQAESSKVSSAIVAQKTLVLKSEASTQNLLSNLLKASLNAQPVLSFKQVKNLETYQKESLIPNLTTQEQIAKATLDAPNSKDLAVLKSFNYDASQNQATDIEQSNSLIDNNIAQKIGITNPVANNSYIKQRALYKAPLQIDQGVLLELSNNQIFTGSQFVINGQIQSDFPAQKNQIEFFIKDFSNQEWKLLGTTQIDENNNFSFLNDSKLKQGKYLVVAEAKTLDSKTINSSVFTIQITTDQFISSPNIKFDRATQSLNLSKLPEDTILTLNLQSVLYSSQAIIGSTNSQLNLNLPQIKTFEPGSKHRITVYAESAQNPTQRSQVEVIEFSIPDPSQNHLYIAIATLILLTTFVIKINVDKSKKRL